MSSRSQRKARRRASMIPQQPRVGAPGGSRPGRVAPTRASDPRRSSKTRHRGQWWAAGSIAVVVLVVGTLVAIAAGSGAQPGLSTIRTGSDAGLGSTAVPAPVSVELAVTSVSPNTLHAVGVRSEVTGPTKIAARGAPLVGSDGKPEVLFVGAEYCPYCAAERWALVVALSRFGSFTGLKATHSSLTDIYPGTQTLSFYGSTYSSTGLDFTPVEIATNQAVGGRYGTLQTLTSSQQSVLNRYDGPPYTTQPGAIPFIDVANRFVMIGASYNPGVLQGRSIGEIAGALSHPSSPIAQAIDGTANVLVAAISKATGIQPTG